MALYILDKAEREGRIKPGGTIVGEHLRQYRHGRRALGGVKATAASSPCRTR